MDGKAVRDVGWDLGGDQPFQEFSAGNEQMYSMSVLAQHVASTSAVRAYVFASHGG